jgi:hypothetical protein
MGVRWAGDLDGSGRPGGGGAALKAAGLEPPHAPGPRRGAIGTRCRSGVSPTWCRRPPWTKDADELITKVKPSKN